MSDPILALQQLTCERDQRPLFSHLSWQCNTGSVLQIVGANGAGKTTLLRTLAGLMRPAVGQVLWRDQPLEASASFARERLFMGHQTPVKGLLTPLENLDWLARLQHCQPQVSLAQALEQVGLGPYMDVACSQLSAGQRRRVLLAQLHLSAAPLWILDEPFTAIDRPGVAALEALIERHRQAGGLIILTSHQAVQLDETLLLDLADFPADAEALLYEGEL